MITEPIFFEGDALGPYIIERQCHAGTCGTLYLAKHEPSNADVLLQSPGRAILNDPDLLGRFIADAQSWMQVGAHPHLLECRDVLLLNGIPLLVSEYIEGRTLRDWIADFQGSDLNVGLEFSIQLAQALEYIHGRGIVHGNLQSKLILLARDGTLKLASQSMAWCIAEGLSPEMLGAEAMHLTAALPAEGAFRDIRDFGFCLYEIFCGRRPDPEVVELQRIPPEPAVLRSDILLPPQLCDVMKRCLDGNLERRPSAAELTVNLCAIYELLNGNPTIHEHLPPSREELLRLYSAGAEKSPAEEPARAQPAEAEPATASRSGSEIVPAAGQNAASRAESDAEIERSIEEFLVSMEESISSTGAGPGDNSRQPPAPAAESGVSEVDQRFSQAVTLHDRADELRARGELDQAESAYQQSLTLAEKAVGPNHPYLAVGLKGLADLYSEQQEFAKAEPLYRRLLSLQERIFGSDSSNVARTVQKLAETYRGQNRHAEAETLIASRK